MKVLLDTCAIMDFLQNREPFAQDAKKIMQAAAMELFIGCITAKSATDIYYLTHRCTNSDKERRSKLNQLLTIIGMLDSMADDVFHAISSDVRDFEDTVMLFHSGMLRSFRTELSRSYFICLPAPALDIQAIR